VFLKPVFGSLRYTNSPYFVIRTLDFVSCFDKDSTTPDTQSAHGAGKETL
jgi:hypothetical protein